MHKKKFNFTPALFILPSFLGISTFVLIPFVDVVIRSFTHMVDRSWCGLENFTTVWANTAFRLAAKNTFYFALVCLPLLLFLSLLIAVLLYRQKQIGKLIKSLFLLPFAIPVASVAVLWQLLFANQGFLNGWLDSFGLSGSDWMNSSYAFWVLIFTYIWKNLGFTIVLWLAGLSSISPLLYEAAQVDGAGAWTCFLKITLPNLLPTLYITVILSLVNLFKIFRESYLVAGDYPHESIYMLQHLFNNWFRNLSLDKLAAGAVINVLVLLVPILFLQKLLGSK